MTTTQHCPGLESNKKLDEVQIKCPKCGKKMDVFSDEMDKKIKCGGCETLLDPAACSVD